MPRQQVVDRRRWGPAVAQQPVCCVGMGAVDDETKLDREMRRATGPECDRVAAHGTDELGAIVAAAVALHLQPRRHRRSCHAVRR